MLKLLKATSILLVANITLAPVMHDPDGTLRRHPQEQASNANIWSRAGRGVWGAQAESEDEPEPECEPEPEEEVAAPIQARVSAEEVKEVLVRSRPFDRRRIETWNRSVHNSDSDQWYNLNIYSEDYGMRLTNALNRWNLTYHGAECVFVWRGVWLGRGDEGMHEVVAVYPDAESVSHCIIQLICAQGEWYLCLLEDDPDGNVVRAAYRVPFALY